MFDWLKIENSVARRRSPGGTAPERVREALERAEAELGLNPDEQKMGPGSGTGREGSMGVGIGVPGFRFLPKTVRLDTIWQFWYRVSALALVPGRGLRQEAAPFIPGQGPAGAGAGI